jgi:hypothetical protein
MEGYIISKIQFLQENIYLHGKCKTSSTRTAAFWVIMQGEVVKSYGHFGKPVGPILRVQ